MLVLFVRSKWNPSSKQQCQKLQKMKEMLKMPKMQRMPTMLQMQTHEFNHAKPIPSQWPGHEKGVGAVVSSRGLQLNV